MQNTLILFVNQSNGWQQDLRYANFPMRMPDAQILPKQYSCGCCANAFMYLCLSDFKMLYQKVAVSFNLSSIAPHFFAALISSQDEVFLQTRKYIDQNVDDIETQCVITRKSYVTNKTIWQTNFCFPSLCNDPMNAYWINDIKPN